MLLVIFTLSSVFIGSFVGGEVCYGYNFSFPLHCSPPHYQGPIYFTPSQGGSRKLVVNEGKAVDPRFKISGFSIDLTDVTERDDGTFTFGGGLKDDPVRLKVLDCAEELRGDYGDKLHYYIPATSEYIEFTPPQSLDQPKILWNRTDPQSRSRGTVKRSVWQMVGLTQADNGFYNFRKKDKSLVARFRLTVKAQTRHYDTKEGRGILIDYPFNAITETVTFKPKNSEMETQMVVEGGRLVIENRRFHKEPLFGIAIDEAEIKDSGIYEFRDREGNLALIAQLEVEKEYSLLFILLGTAAAIILVGAICICCCCRKKCCKKDQPPQTAAAPQVYYHNEYQPPTSRYSDAPASSASYQPVSSRVPKEPTTASPESLPYGHVIHGNPSQPEVLPSRGQQIAPVAPVSSDLPSSDPEPRFELKGLTYPLASPLSSESTSCDVYT
ncbi:uncharacterized protein KZ484_009424 [Pholidichthys leucotaenia]